MRFRLLSLAVASLLLLPAACRTDIDETPAAEVTETTATMAGESPAPTPTSSTPVVKEKSRIGFIGAKITRQHVGEFKEFDGRIDYAGATPVGVNFSINTPSIETDTPKLTGHLKSADFFDVAKYPTATFEAKTIRPEAGPEGATHVISGNLTMHGVTKEVTFPAKVETTPEGVHATANFKINRHDWGISYRGAPDDLIRDDVAIQLDLWFPPAPSA